MHRTPCIPPAMLRPSPQSPPDQQVVAKRQQLVIHANYELFVLALTLLQVINAVLWLFLRDQREGKVVVLISVGISICLIVDSCYRFAAASGQRQHPFKTHSWLLWLGSLPLPFFALLRVLWYRLFAGIVRRSDFRVMMDVVVKKRAQSTLLGVVLAAIVMLEAAAMLILGAESRSHQANIQTASDAVWWTIVTTATVGYGDKYPVTSAGRVIGVLVMIVGVSLFSVLTSFLAQWFLRSRQPQPEKPINGPANSEESTAVLARLDALTALLEQQDARQRADAADVRARLAEIEDWLGQQRTKL